MVIEMPRVSIIVPFYNNREWIFDTVQSICNQNYENIELILVDDGSNDGSSECITRFVNSIDWVTLYTTNQVGLSKARNIALKKITGEYVMFVDGDDMLAENAVNKLIDVVRENEPDFVAFSFFKLMKKTKKKISIIPGESRHLYGLEWQKFYRRIIGPVGEEIKDVQRLELLSTVWGKLYKTDILKHEFLGYSENYPEDLLFNVKNLKYVNKGFFLDEPLYIYNRMNMHSSTVTLPFDVKFDGNNKLMDLLDDELSGEVELEAALMNRKVLRALNLMITLVNDDRMLEEKITLSKQLCYKISTSIDHKKWKSSIKYLGLFRFYYYFGALKENYRLLYFMTWVVVKIKDFKNGK